MFACQMKSHLNFPVFLFSCAGMEGERPARLNRGEADRDAYRRSAAPRQYTNTTRLYSDFMWSCAVSWNEQHEVCLVSINQRMVFISGCLSNLWLLPSAGADKKAEAGAGAATEFQFVSIAVLLSHRNIASRSRYACRLQPVLILFLAQGFSFGQNLSRIGKTLNWICSVRHGVRPTDVLTHFLSVAEGWLWTWQRTAASVIFTHFLYNKENQNMCVLVWFY